MADTSSPGGISRRDPLAARMLKSSEFSQHEESILTPKIRHRGNLIPPCSRDRCKICSRHFLSASARSLLQSQNDYIFIDEEDAKQKLLDLSRGINTNWLRLREYSQQAADAIPSLKAETLQECIESAFPGLLSDQLLADIRYKRYLGVNKICDINDGLKLPDFWANMTLMETGLNYIVHVITERSSRHPGQFVAVDNSELQLGWTSLLFHFTASNVFVNLSPASYGTAAISTPVEPSALHSAHVFTYERGILILQRQDLIYQSLADLAVKICNDIATSPSTSLPPVKIPPSAERSALTQMHAETGSYVCRADSFLEKARADLLEYTNNHKNNQDAMDNIEEWLLDAGCPKEVVFCCSVSIHVDDRLDCMMGLHKLQHSLQQLLSAAKARLERNESRTKLMEAREQVEVDVTNLIRRVACYLVKQNKYFGTSMYVLYDHGGDYLELLRCNSDHVSNGLTRTIWQLFGLIELRAPVSDAIDLAISEVTKNEGQFRPGVVQEAIPWLKLLKGVIDTIESICPCSGVVPKTLFAGYLLASIFQSHLQCADLHSIEDLRESERRDPNGWAEMLWSKALPPLEHLWEIQDFDNVRKRSLRRLLGMRAPPKKPRKRKSQAALREAAGNASDAEVGSEEAQDVAPQPSTHNPARSKAQRMRVQNHDPLAHLFHVNESLSKFGISEGFRWGTDSATPRASQFEDSSELCSSRPKTAKRWQAAATLEDNDSPTVDHIIAVELPTPELIVFADADLYDIWRQVFPSTGEAGGGNTRSRIRWHDLRRVLVAEPLSMVEIRVSMPECKWRRPALHGYEEKTITLHQPHGMNGWLERTYLFVVRSAFRHVFGWDAESFALKT